jgi:hypothetical protein
MADSLQSPQPPFALISLRIFYGMDFECTQWSHSRTAKGTGTCTGTASANFLVNA